MLRGLADRLAESPLAFHYLRKLPELGYHATKRRLRALAAEQREGLVLDAGCGTGEFAPLFDPARYVGVDIHPGFVEFARRHNPRHRFEHADVIAWPGAGEPFAFVLVNGVLHHLDDATARALLQAVLAQARPGATLVVIEDVELPRAGLGARLVHGLDHGHFIRGPDDWTRLVAGLVPIERSESYVSGVCPYQMMVCRRP
jgi:SAM-dependent methyltransferase